MSYLISELVQVDTAYMFEDTETQDRFFLCMVDCFSFKMSVKCLKRIDADSVASKLEELIEEFGAPIYEIQTGM